MIDYPLATFVLELLIVFFLAIEVWINCQMYEWKQEKRRRRAVQQYSVV